MSDFGRDSIKHLEEQLGAGTYYKRDLELVRGRGARLWDADGREFIDCVGGQGAANLGLRKSLCGPGDSGPDWKSSWCVSELFYHEQRARLLENLERLSPTSIQRFFLCNSGSEAVEVALKFARLATGRQEIVAAMRGFHGKTFGALSATWSRDYRRSLRAPGSGIHPRSLQPSATSLRGRHRPYGCFPGGGRPG